MLKTYYHATPYQNLVSIIDEGIKTSSDGVVFLCEQPDEAARFVAVRGHKQILSLGVELDESKVKESFDHSEEFFKCKAYIYSENIPTDKIISFTKYEL